MDKPVDRFNWFCYISNRVWQNPNWSYTLKIMSLLNDIDSRSREIFRQIVDAFIETGDPVSSRTLAQGNQLDLSPATIRNTMADLTELGLLEAPHISAGRRPTEIGLRLFVDGLLEIGNLAEEERAVMEQSFGKSGGVEEILGDTATRLSGLTQTASLVLTSKSESPVQHIEFVRTSLDKALVVLVHDNGDVENRIITIAPGLPVSALNAAGNYLNTRLRGRTLSEARAEILREVDEKKAALDTLTAELVREGVVAQGGDGTNLIVRGQANLLSSVDAENLERVKVLFDDLEKGRDVIDLLEAASAGDGVRIFIGSETQLFSLSGSSVIVAPYMDQHHQIVGVLGVIGPTRLNYARIIPMVNYTAEWVSRKIARNG